MSICSQPISIAPMMRRTDRHYRYLMRQITKQTLLYTEMIPAEGILRGALDEKLRFSPIEHPVVLQLGGNCPEQLAEAARIGGSYGYDEINLNLCCPSQKVQHGDFGVCLMDRPEHVATCVRAIREATPLSISIKHRIGFDEHDSYEFLYNFVSQIAEAGCTKFTVHARKAWLEGLSPSDNRNIPPLRYDFVYRLKRDFPDCFIELNGGVDSIDEAEKHLKNVDAVMIGRAAYNHPYMFADVDERVFDVFFAAPSREQIVNSMVEYYRNQLQNGEPLQYMSRHLRNLFAYQRGASRWRQRLNEWASNSEPHLEDLKGILEEMPSATKSHSRAS